MLPTSFPSLRRPTDRSPSRLTSVTATVINVYVNERIGCIHVHLTAISIHVCGDMMMMNFGAAAADTVVVIHLSPGG